MRAWLTTTLASATLASALLASSGHADERSAPVRFQLVWLREGAAAGCPSPREARAQVRAWLGRDPFSDDAEQVIEATVREQGGRLRATVRVRDGQGRPRGSRSFEDAGPGCAAIARAALLAVVLTIDPDAPVSPPASPSAPAPPVVPPAPAPPASSSTPAPPVVPPAPAPASASSPAPMSGATPARALTPPPPASVPTGSPATSTAATGSPTPDTTPGPGELRPLAPRSPGPRGELAIGAGLALGVLPQAGALASITGAIRLGDALALQLGARWLPLRRSDDREASFGLTAGQAGVCVAPLQGSIGALQACGGLALGALTAVVHRLEPLRPGSEAWAAATLGGRARLDLPAALFVRLGAEALVPLRRLTYHIASSPPRQVFAAPSLGGSLALEVGVHFR